MPSTLPSASWKAAARMLTVNLPAGAKVTEAPAFGPGAVDSPDRGQGHLDTRRLDSACRPARESTFKRDQAALFECTQ